MVDAYYMWPFWLLVLFLLRCVCGWYYAAFISAVLFGSVEVLKAPKASHSVWAQLTRGVTKIGHRACALNAPENTIAGVNKAAELGVKAIEIDVLISADGVPFVFHDSSADRTTNGKGLIENMLWRDIQKLQIVDKGKLTNERVPSLEEVLRESNKHGMTVFLDVKGSQPMAMVKVIRDMLREFPDLYKWAVVCSFYPQTLYAVKWSIPQFSTILTHRPWVLMLKDPAGPLRNDELWKRVIAPVADMVLEVSIYSFWWYMCGVNGVFIQEEVMSIRERRFWEDRNIDMFIWTVNNHDRKSYLDSLHVPYLTDDCS